MTGNNLAMIGSVCPMKNCANAPAPGSMTCPDHTAPNVLSIYMGRAANLGHLTYTPLMLAGEPFIMEFRGIAVFDGARYDSIVAAPIDGVFEGWFQDLMIRIAALARADLDSTPFKNGRLYLKVKPVSQVEGIEKADDIKRGDALTLFVRLGLYECDGKTGVTASLHRAVVVPAQGENGALEFDVASA